MQLEQFWENANAGLINFAWVDVNDKRECPDCFAIATSQDTVNGHPFDEWEAYGLPGAGHTVCNRKCRCRLVPLPVIDNITGGSGNLLDYIVTRAEDDGEKITQLTTMIQELKDEGVDIAELQLFGKTAKEQREIIEKAHAKKNPARGQGE